MKVSRRSPAPTAGALRNGDVRLFVSLFVSLSRDLALWHWDVVNKRGNAYTISADPVWLIVDLTSGVQHFATLQ